MIWLIQHDNGQNLEFGHINDILPAGLLTLFKVA